MMRAKVLLPTDKLSPISLFPVPPPTASLYARDDEEAVLWMFSYRMQGPYSISHVSSYPVVGSGIEG